MIINDVNCAADLPEFVTVTFIGALVTATVCAAKLSVAGATVIVEGVAAPVPASATACGLPVALSAIEIDAARGPDAVGVNVALITQFAFADSAPAG